MKLGIQPDVRDRPKDAFEFAASEGFTHVEILMDHPLYSMENLSYTELLELKESYEIDLLIHAPANSMNFLSISQSMRMASYEELRRVIQYAEKCEASVVTFHIGWNPGFITAKGFVFPEELYDRHNYRVIKEELRPFIKELNCEFLALENTISLNESLKRGIELLFESTDLKITFDIGHYNCRRGHDLFLKYFDRVVNVHAHDNDGTGDMHLALGEGNVNLEILRGYNGYITIEVREREAIIKSKKYILNVLR